MLVFHTAILRGQGRRCYGVLPYPALAMRTVDTEQMNEGRSLLNTFNTSAPTD